MWVSWPCSFSSMFQNRHLSKSAFSRFKSCPKGHPPRIQSTFKLKIMTFLPSSTSNFKILHFWADVSSARCDWKRWRRKKEKRTFWEKILNHLLEIFFVQISESNTVIGESYLLFLTSKKFSFKISDFNQKDWAKFSWKKIIFKRGKIEGIYLFFRSRDNFEPWLFVRERN